MNNQLEKLEIVDNFEEATESCSQDTCENKDELIDLRRVGFEPETPKIMSTRSKYSAFKTYITLDFGMSGSASNNRK